MRYDNRCPIFSPPSRQPKRTDNNLPCTGGIHETFCDALEVYVKKIIRPEQLFLSTIADDAPETAAAYGFGLELAEFCTASNMDLDFEQADALARGKMARAGRRMLHAPFNELCPSAIDPLILEVAKKRYAQAYELARGYGINRMVVHSGYVPLIYFPEYFAGRAVEFWREYLETLPDDFTVVMENVLEDSPDMLIDIAREVGDPRFRLCLDIGHANITKKGLTIEDWTRAVLPYLGHAHLHNNFGWPDSHNALDDGEMDVAALLALILEGPPDLTLTLEVRESRRSVGWLIDRGLLAL